MGAGTVWILDRLVGVRGNIRDITFFESGRPYRCYVWDDALWGAFKDNLILFEYERAGVRLRTSRPLVIDAGAHVGLFSLRASQHAGRVVALEPHPMNFGLLTMNLERNFVRNVVPLRVALSGSAEGALLAAGPGSSGGSISRVSDRNWKVQSIRLDDLIRDYGPVDLLKVDIEGAEFDVFQTAADDVLQRISTVVAELHLRFNEGRDRELAERLSSLGFRVTILEAPIAEWRDSLLRILKNWGKSRDLLRVKSVVLATYLLAPLVRVIARGTEMMDEDQLRFLYAVQAPAEEVRGAPVRRLPRGS
jgi:FkbM family methyltransferase